MLIKSLTLYKTNLDPYYKNVYDDYTSIDTYLQFLNQTFQKIDISISNPKSSMDNNGNFRICVSGYNSMELHHFNYIAFDNYLQSEESDYKFAFILSVESQNDGQTSSCILNCRLDAWTENYLSIKANSSSNIFVANRCTFDSYNSKYLYLFSSRYMPNIYYTVKNDFVSEALIDRTNNVPSSLQNIRILWERIRVDPAQHFYDTTTTTHYNLGSSDTMLCGAYRCEAGWLIRPIAVFVGNEPFNKSGSYYITARVYENGHEHTDYHILSNTIPVRPSDLFGVYVYNSEYTFFPPFRYELDLQLTEGDEFRFIIKPLSTAHHLIRYKCGTDDASSIITAFGIPEIGDFGSNSTGRIDISLTRYKPTFTKTVTRFSSIYDDILANDEMFYRYPFARTAIMWNDKQVILSGNSSTDHIHLYVDLYSSIHPSVWITNDTLKRMAIKDVVRNTGSVYSMSTSLDSYLTRNLNMIMNSLTSTLYSGIFNGAKQLVGSMGSFANKKYFSSISSSIGALESAEMTNIKLEAFEAQEKDASNTPSTIQSGSEYAYDDIFLQDDICILYQHSSGWDSVTERSYLIDCHRNGFTIPLSVCPVQKRRDIFDYDELIGCSIVGVNNKEDFDEINSAFNRGIRRWHINNNSNDGRRQFLKDFNCDVANFTLTELGV